MFEVWVAEDEDVEMMTLTHVIVGQKILQFLPFDFSLGPQNLETEDLWGSEAFPQGNIPGTEDDASRS